MNQQIPGALLPDPKVIEDPYPERMKQPQ